MAWRSPVSHIRRSRVLSAAAVAAVATGSGVVLYAWQQRRHGANRLPTPLVPLQRDSSGALQPPTLPAVPPRAAQLAALRQSGTAPEAEYDLLVIGGGATGTGIALDAATRGLKVALVERADFASGTSSKSTKLVHGGVRYLEKAVWNLDYGQLELVIEALAERKTFLEIAPHLASALPILLPLQHWWQVPYFWVGTKAYDLLSGARGLDGSYWLSRAKALAAFPALRGDRVVGGLVYYDGQQNDARTNVALALTAMLYGATVANYAEVVGLEKDARGRITGARVRDVLAADGSFVVRAKGVVNATGPFADGIEHLDSPSKPALVAPSSGAHVVLPGSICPTGMGLLDASTSDGRVVFVLPWEGHTLAGTTDSPCGIETDPKATDAEIDFILKEVSKLVSSDAPIARSDVLAAWSGIRPLVRDPHAKNTESLVRSHIVTVAPSGLLTCAGGKWTTYRSMAEDAVDHAIEAFHLTPRRVALPAVGAAAEAASIPAATTGACLTSSIPLIGAHGYSAALPAQLMEVYPALDAAVAQHLASNYGDRAWSVLSASAPVSAPPKRLLPDWPITEAEVRYGVRSEAACTAVDVLARRTRLAFVDVHAAVRALPRIVDIMGDELGWSAAVRARETSQSMAFLESMGLHQCQQKQPLALAAAESDEQARLQDQEQRQWAAARAKTARLAAASPEEGGADAAPVHYNTKSAP